MSWVRFPSPAPTISPNRAIRSRLPSLLAAKPVVVYLHCHKLPKMRSPVLTNDPGIDISAAPPEFSSGELHSHTMPTLPRSSDLAACPGRGQNLKKVRPTARAADASQWQILPAPLTKKRSFRIEIFDLKEINAKANTLLRTMRLVRILKDDGWATQISRKFFEISVDLGKGFG